MANVLVRTCQAARATLARCLLVSAWLVCMGQRIVALCAGRAWSSWLTSVGRPPAVGQQFLDSTVRQRGQSREHVLEVGPRPSASTVVWIVVLKLPLLRSKTWPDAHLLPLSLQVGSNDGRSGITYSLPASCDRASKTCSHTPVLHQ